MNNKQFLEMLSHDFKVIIDYIPNNKKIPFHGLHWISGKERTLIKIVRDTNNDILIKYNAWDEESPICTIDEFYKIMK